MIGSRPATMRPSPVTLIGVAPNASVASPPGSRTTRLTLLFQKSCSVARPRGAPSVWTSETFSSPVRSIQVRSRGIDARTFAALSRSNTNDPTEASAQATPARQNAIAAACFRPTSTTARTEKIPATIATTSVPVPTESSPSSRKTANRNGESCLLSAAVKPESGTRTERRSIAPETTATASRCGQPRFT